MNVGDAIRLDKDAKDADFWIISSGNNRGKPVSQYRDGEGLIGVKVTRTDLIFPKYLHYLVEYLWQKGEFAGAINCVECEVHVLTPDDVLRVLERIGISML